MARKMVTRLRASLYVRERVASRLQCSVARICSLAAALDSRPAGATSVDIGFPSVHSEHAGTGPGCATSVRVRQVVPVGAVLRACLSYWTPLVCGVDLAIRPQRRGRQSVPLRCAPTGLWDVH